jgi:hypothetical protein
MVVASNFPLKTPRTLYEDGFSCQDIRSRYGIKPLSGCAIAALYTVIIIQTVRLFYHNGLRALESWEGSWYYRENL